jgi:hypothetical protein
MKSKGSLPCTQEPSIGPCPEPDPSKPESRAEDPQSEGIIRSRTQATEYAHL